MVVLSPHIFKSTLISLSLFIGVFVSVVSAQDPVVNNANLKVYGCINAVLCSDSTAHTDNDFCKSTSSDEHDIYPHRSRVFSTTPLDPNVNTYVTECVLTSKGNICTTGSSRLDKMLFCGNENDTRDICDHYKILRDELSLYYLYPDPDGNGGNWPGYTVYYSNNTNYTSVAEAKTLQVALTRTASQDERGPVVTDSNGRLPIVEWQGYVPEYTSRTYAAFQIVSATPTPSPTVAQPGVNPTLAAGVGGQQQGTLQFVTPTPFTPPPGGCDTLTYDPYGRIFDAVSLEPIALAQVSLLQMDPRTKEFSLAYAQSRSAINVNPQSSYKDGGFSFLVEDGDYKLQPTLGGYNFLSKAEQTLGSNVTQIYSDIYYADSPVIKQRGSIQHRDIPLQPIDGVGKVYDIQIISQNQEPVLKNGVQIVNINGQVSHPFAKTDVHICGVQPNSATETCNLYKSYTSSNGGPDKYGVFSFDIDQSELASGQRFRVDFTKQDLTQNILTNAINLQDILVWIQDVLGVGIVQAQEKGDSTSLNIEPMVAYIEGYAYDAEGTILPNATIHILIPFAKRPVHSATANENGYYRITSEYLPTSPYTISYTSSAGVTSEITTSQFLLQNKEFISSENVDPIKYVTESTNPRRTITPSFIPQQKIAPISGIPQPIQTVSPIQKIEETSSRNNPLYLVGAIVLLLMGGAGALIGLHMFRKRSVTE
ncbi:MAG: carboxypeptidase-like regulatory domain-containing protein [bacterium]|nr:carboxypeptidase-like regulatory domain-containing protein [bacterium]